MLLGKKAAGLAPELAARGFKVTYDPADGVDVVVADVATCRFAPESAPLVVLGTGTPADWAARQARPDAVFVTTLEDAIRAADTLVPVPPLDRADESGNNGASGRPEGKDAAATDAARPAAAPRAAGALTAVGGEGLLVLTYANKGGVGKTTVALGVALALAGGGVPVALCDLDFGGPDVAGFFNLRPGRGAESLPDATAVDLLVKVKENLYVLPGPAGAEMPRLAGEQLAAAVDSLRREFPVVIGDTPPAPWEKAYLHGVFARAGLVYAVVDQSKFSVQETQKYAPVLLAMGVVPQRIRIVVNRFNPKLVSVREIERAFSSGFKKGVKDLPRAAAVIPEGWEEQVKAAYQGRVPPRGEWAALAREVAETAGLRFEEKEKVSAKTGRRLFVWPGKIWRNG
jgi:MinD-like ATPase involved in chromosome partitioning or flagellar assembly